MASERKPIWNYPRASRVCMACREPFPARYELVPPTNRRSWLENQCPACKGSKAFREDSDMGQAFPHTPPRGIGAEVKRAKGVESTDHYRLGWANRRGMK